MRFIKNNFWTMLATIFVVTLSFVSDASAQTFFVTTQGKLIQLFQNVKLIVFIVGGFGLVAVAFAAIFGKIQWKWFAGLAAGLAILAAAAMAIEYVTGSTAWESSNNNTVVDTFGNI